MSRGIYLVANQVSEKHCLNLITSIRRSGCKLPIRLIPFGGAPVTARLILDQVTVMKVEDFPTDGLAFINELSSLLTCPRGFLLRFLSFFGDWDEFIYSDNDIVSLMDWSELFGYLSPGGNALPIDIVHADQEFITKGKYNYRKPELLLDYFGPQAMDSLLTAGHYVARRDLRLVTDMRRGLEWMRAHPDIVTAHDQTLMHVSALLGNWKIRNLCRDPQPWGSSWAGDYPDTLSLIQATNGMAQHRISHLHFSGGWPDGSKAVDVLLLSYLERNAYNRQVMVDTARHCTGYNRLRSLAKRARRKLRTLCSP